jgi:FkbM family methyltransferase
MKYIKKFIPPILMNLLRKSKKVRGNYIIGKYRIKIPPNFALPFYQEKFRLYDRFLPILAKNLPSNKTIIDVGANIGDTAVAILQKCDNQIICIEPSDLFFPYLEENLKSLTPDDFSRVRTLKKFVGTGLLTGELTHNEAGTATIKINDKSNTSSHIELDKLVDDTYNVVLLKVDTDGFDFDVIQSAEKVCSNSEPILFWENEISEDFQSIGFNALYSFLTIKGYKYIYIFDNFGNLITEESNFETLKNINSYLISMKKNDCTRTVYYTDILATTEKYHLIAKNAIEEYKKEWINKIIIPK